MEAKNSGDRLLDAALREKDATITRLVAALERTVGDCDGLVDTRYIQKYADELDVQASAAPTHCAPPCSRPKEAPMPDQFDPQVAVGRFR